MFSADQDQPHASVNLDTCGGVLTDTAVRGIVALVAGAIPGLTGTNIAVDRPGGPLAVERVVRDRRRRPPTRWPPRAPGRAASPAIAQSALDHLVGVGNGSAIVAGQLNFDETTEKTQTFGGQKGAIQNSTETEKLTQNGGANGGVTGTSANIPGAAVTNGSASSDYTHDKKRRHQRRSTPRRPTPRRWAARRSRCPSRSWSRRRRSRASSRARRRTRRPRPRPRRSCRTRSRTRSGYDADEHAEQDRGVRRRRAPERRPVAEGGGRAGGRRGRRGRRRHAHSAG